MEPKIIKWIVRVEFILFSIKMYLFDNLVFIIKWKLLIIKWSRKLMEWIKCLDSLDWNKMEVLNNKMVCDWAMGWLGIHN